VQTKPPPPALQPRPVQQALPDAQIAIEKARREEAEKREAEKRELARAQAERRKKELAAKQQAEKETALLDAQHQANVKRMLGQAGATGDAATPGTAAQSAGPSAGYAGRIKARIKPNILFTDSISGDPLATLEVRLAPDGTIVARKLLKTSGVKAWDEAVLRAIDKTEVLPRDLDGRVPPVIEIDFKPRD
jgi:colicin import membrane protein